MKRNAADVLDQLGEAGVLSYIVPGSVNVNSHSISGDMNPDVVFSLREHPEFQEGEFHRLHKVGPNQTEFRSYRKAFGDGSLQIVIDERTGRFEADVDVFSPYEDLVGVFGHMFGEVVPHAVRRWVNRIRRKAA